MREEWDRAPLDGKGRRVRRVRGGGSGSGSGSGGWSGFCEEPFPLQQQQQHSSSSFFDERGGLGGGFEGRREASSSFSGGLASGGLRRVGNVIRDSEEDWENDTVLPTDSISQVSASPTGRSGFESGRHSQSRYSGRSCGIEDGMSGLGMGSGGGSGISRSSRSGGGMVSMANGLLVRVEAPGWA